MASKNVNTLVVLLMASLGTVVLVPMLHYLRERAFNEETANRIKALVVAVHSCNDVHKYLPPAYDAFASIREPASIHVHLTPFLDQDSSVAFHCPWDPTLDIGERVQKYAANLRAFSDAGVNLGHGKPAASVPLAAVMPGKAKLTGTIIDGTSNTIAFVTKFAVCAHGGSQFDANPISPFAAFFGEKPATKLAHPSDPDAAFQLAPREFECRASPLMGQSFSRDGIKVGMFDGSVRTVSPRVSPTTWNAAVQPNDSIPLSSDW